MESFEASKKETMETATLERQYINFSCNGAVKERLLALTDEKKAWAVRCHQALNIVFSRSTSFTSISEHPKSEYWWLSNEVETQCSAGTVFFAIDTYTPFGQFPIEAEDEKEWDIWLNFISKNPKQLCNEIARAIQEVIKIKVYWELKDKTDDAPLTLILTHKQGYIDFSIITDSNGKTGFKWNKWDTSDVEEI